MFWVRSRCTRISFEWEGPAVLQKEGTDMFSWWRFGARLDQFDSVLFMIEGGCSHVQSMRIPPGKTTRHRQQMHWSPGLQLSGIQAAIPLAMICI